ncbi:hypothetical protein CYMTET_4410 [Cymbomonas tetramitiformis]|uniref:Uncharacterized protein n=1 Tax=Cymbomonas tetramitiformis TaxID=36881 RepID=A0AAE0H1I4_9CHLO|nr:hypothetical protein CYMTET_4410 [Cymbomonas tetramitiformis]|eukprot:gene16403-19473_t
MDDRRLCDELHSRGHVALARVVALRLLSTAPFEETEITSVASAEDSVDLSTDTSSSVDVDIPETSRANTDSDVEEPPAPAWVAHFDREVLRYLLSDALLP